jgi:hypothetical protein
MVPASPGIGVPFPVSVATCVNGGGKIGATEPEIRRLAARIRLLEGSDTMRDWSMDPVLVLVVAVIIAAGSVLLARQRGQERLQDDAAPVGVIVAIAVTVYSLLLGLTVVGTYDRFTEADMSVTDELNALFTTTRLADAYPEPYRTEIKGLAVRYAQAVNANELMGDDRTAFSIDAGRAAIRDLYAVYAAMANDGRTYSTLTSSVTALMSLDDARGVRLSLETEVLPTSLWLVLVVGGVMTVLAISLVAPRSRVLHLLVSIVTTTIIVMLLNLVSEMDRPFTYPVRVNTERFERGVADLEAEAAFPASGGVGAGGVAPPAP